jgi:hypothetical protein
MTYYSNYLTIHNSLWIEFPWVLKEHSFWKDIRVVPRASYYWNGGRRLWVVTCNSQLENQLEHQHSHDGRICFHLHLVRKWKLALYIIVGFHSYPWSSLLSGLPMFLTIVLNGSPSSSQVLPNCATTAPSWKSFWISFKLQALKASFQISLSNGSTFKPFFLQSPNTSLLKDLSKPIF